MKKEKSGEMQLVESILDMLARLVLVPTVVFGLGALGGFFLENFIGQYVANGLNVIFINTTITPDQLPLVFGTFALISNYIRPRIEVK